MENNKEKEISKELIGWLEEKTNRTFNSSEMKIISLWQKEYEFEAVQLVCEDIIDRYSSFDVRSVDNVLFSYEKKGSDMVEAIKNDIRTRIEKEFEFNKVVEGLRLNRPLKVGESVFIKRWLGWGFSPKGINYAVDRTYDSLGSLNFKYINAILVNWKYLGVVTDEQISSHLGYPREEKAHNEERITVKDLVQCVDEAMLFLICDRDYKDGIRYLYKGPAKELQEFLDREIYWMTIAGLDTLLIEI